jgi:hypothetical protein
MGKNKKTRVKLESWLKHISLHEEKIAKELSKPQPDMGLVVHWEGEIRGALLVVARLRKRLTGGKKWP